MMNGIKTSLLFLLLAAGIFSGCTRIELNHKKLTPNKSGDLSQYYGVWQLLKRDGKEMKVIVINPMKARGELEVIEVTDINTNPYTALDKGSDVRVLKLKVISVLKNGSVVVSLSGFEKSDYVTAVSIKDNGLRVHGFVKENLKVKCAELNWKYIEPKGGIFGKSPRINVPDEQVEKLKQIDWSQCIDYDTVHLTHYRMVSTERAKK